MPINCPGTCSAVYLFGTNVVLTATPDSGSGSIPDMDIYIMSPFNAVLRIMHLSNNPGVITIGPNITISAVNVSGVNGAAIDPTTGIVYVIARQGSNRRLGTLNVSTGVVTVLGTFADSVSAIAFTSAGVMYTVTGSGATNPHVLYTVNLTNAALTFVHQFVNLGVGGDCIAINPNDGFLYRTFSFPSVLQKMDLGSLVVTTISSNLVDDEVTSMMFEPQTGLMIFSTLDGRYYISTTLGVTTPLLRIGDTYRGAVEFPPTAFTRASFFNGWSGDVPSGHEADNPVTIIMNSDKTVICDFELLSWILNVSFESGGDLGELAPPSRNL